MNKIITTIKNNKIVVAPQYDIVSTDRLTTYGFVIRLRAEMPRTNRCHGSNRWDILVYVNAEDNRRYDIRFDFKRGLVVGRTSGVDYTIAPYYAVKNELGSDDLIYVDLIPRDRLCADRSVILESEYVCEDSFGFVKDEDGNRKQIAIFPWKCRW
jgi:hypothetical protein